VADIPHHRDPRAPRGRAGFATVTVGATALQVKVVRYRQRIVTAQPGRRGVVVTAEQLGIPVKTALTRSIVAAERIGPGYSPELGGLVP